MPRSAADRILLALLCAYVVGSAWLFRHWWVDDAAITFAYARNLAQGDGLVAFPGAERSEGFSNPLWMGLLALGQVVGLDPFPLSKILGTLLAAATVPLTWAVARQVPTPDAVPGARRWMPLLAAGRIDRNAFPRAILLEAVLRYLEERLAAPVNPPPAAAAPSRRSSPAAGSRRS